MSAFTVANISENTAEDFVDEGVTNLVYAISNCYFGGATTNSTCSSIVESSFKEALEGAEQTLRFSIMNAVIMRVTTYAMSKLVLAGGLFYAYVKGGGFIQKLKDKFSGKSFKGKKGMYAMQTMISSASGTEAERLKLVGMANDSVNNVTSVIAKEREIATQQVAFQKQQIMNQLGLSQKAKGLNDQKKIQAYLYKMKTGTWTTSVTDKKLFESVVPKSYRQNDFVYNQAFVTKLNEFQEYAKTTENKLVNLAQTHLDLMTANSLSKVK